MTAEHDARAIIDALAEPLTLLVFAAIVTATSTARPTCKTNHLAANTSSTTYVTPFGLRQQLTLPRDAIEWAADRLNQAGLLGILTDHERRYDSWRINQAALTTVAAQLNTQNA